MGTVEDPAPKVAARAELADLSDASMQALGAVLLGGARTAEERELAESESLPPIGDELGLSPLEVIPRWTGRMLLVLGLLTLPWIAILAVELPNRTRVAHDDVTWAGFDVLLCGLLLRTGWSALRKREHIELTAGMTGALLIVDAWFDVTSAATPRQLALSSAMALCVELPLAAFCLWIAGRVEFARRRRSERLTGLVGRLDARGFAMKGRIDKISDTGSAGNAELE